MLGSQKTAMAVLCFNYTQQPLQNRKEFQKLQQDYNTAGFITPYRFPVYDYNRKR